MFFDVYVSKETLGILAVVAPPFPSLIAPMDSPARTISSRDDQQEVLPIESAETRELRALREEVNRLKRLTVQLSNQLATEEARRQVAPSAPAVHDGHAHDNPGLSDPPRSGHPDS